MTRPMTVRERIAITVAVCLAIIVAIPMSVLAATGQLVNIIDPSNAARQAGVSAVGALQVEARLGIPSGAFSLFSNRTGNGWINAGQGATSKSIAFTEVTITAVGPSGWLFVDIGYAQNSASGCGTPAFSPIGLRRVRIANNSMQQLLFPTPLFSASAATGGTKWCIGAVVSSAPTGTVVHYGVSGYSFAP